MISPSQLPPYRKKKGKNEEKSCHKIDSKTIFLKILEKLKVPKLFLTIFDF